VLSLLGDRVNRLRIPFFGRGGATEESRFWSAIVRRVMRRPALSFALAAGLLVAAAIPVLGMNIGAAGIGTLPDSLVSKQGLLALERSFPAAGAQPARIVIDGEPGSSEVRAAVSRLQEELAADPAFGRPTVEEGAPSRSRPTRSATRPSTQSRSCVPTTSRARSRASTRRCSSAARPRRTSTTST
jgi:RND superfamily putative drug exporter